MWLRKAFQKRKQNLKKWESRSPGDKLRLENRNHSPEQEPTVTGEAWKGIMGHPGERGWPLESF